MTLQLSKALHDDVDGDGDAPFDVGPLASRIRRRRVVRHGVRGAVATGAVGAVVLVGTRGTWDPDVRLPAADPGAAPGTCGSDIAALPQAGAAAGVELVWTLGSHTSESGPPPRELGSLFGRHLRAGVVVPPSAVGLSGGAAAQPLLDEPATTSPGVQVLVTHDGTVVSIPKDPFGTFDLVDDEQAMGFLRADLTVCTDHGAGSDPLPAGRYALYASYRDAATGDVTAAGPWSVSLEDGPGRLAAGLPADFPDEVAVLDGRLATASREDDGWLVEVVVDALDSASAAETLLQDHGARANGKLRDGLVAGMDLLDTRHWRVSVFSSTTPDGEPSVVYQIAPLPGR